MNYLELSIVITFLKLEFLAFCTGFKDAQNAISVLTIPVLRAQRRGNDISALTMNM